MGYSTNLKFYSFRINNNGLLLAPELLLSILLNKNDKKLSLDNLSDEQFVNLITSISIFKIDQFTEKRDDVDEDD